MAGMEAGPEPGASGTNEDARTIARDGLDALFHALGERGYAIIGPTPQDGSIEYDDLESPAQLPIGWRDVQAPGSYRVAARDDRAVFGHVVGQRSFRHLFHAPRERLFQLRRRDASFEPVSAFEPDAPARRIALFGARACDLAGIDIQDQILMRGAFPDPRYAARRSDVVVIAVACNEPGATCFCASMNTGPTPHTGYDLALTELLPENGRAHRFLVHIGSPAGRDILDSLASTEADDHDLEQAEHMAARARASMGRTLDTRGIKELLYGAAEHPRWNDVASRCLACTNCTLVCPTCFCSRVDDVTTLDGQTAERVRSWDSCYSLEHSYMHGGPVRTTVLSRYRQWLTHKLASWIDQFGSSGCVGCGRCITWCPAGIDITEEVAAIRAQPMPPDAKGYGP